MVYFIPLQLIIYLTFIKSMKLKTLDQTTSPKFISSEYNLPLVVDLDGTLIKSDLLYEGIIMLLRKNPLFIFKCILWALKGKVHFKNKVFAIAQLRYDLLPANISLLSFLHAEFVKGRKLILCHCFP